MTLAYSRLECVSGTNGGPEVAMQSRADLGSGQSMSSYIDEKGVWRTPGFEKIDFAGTIMLDGLGLYGAYREYAAMAAGVKDPRFATAGLVGILLASALTKFLGDVLSITSDDKTRAALSLVGDLIHPAGAPAAAIGYGLLEKSGSQVSTFASNLFNATRSSIDTSSPMGLRYGDLIQLSIAAEKLVASLTIDKPSGLSRDGADMAGAKLEAGDKPGAPDAAPSNADDKDAVSDSGGRNDDL
jgi:hypothetical protein